MSVTNGTAPTTGPRSPRQLADIDGRELWEQVTAADRAHHAETAWRSSVPHRFADLTLDTLEALDPPPSPEAIRSLRAWAANPVRNVILIGTIGAGKTGAAIAAVDAAVTNRAVAARFCVYTELLDAFRDGDLKVRDVARIPLLVIDELGGGRSAPTEYEAEKTEMLINRRYLDGLPIVATTNLEPDQLRSRIGERAYDRLRDGALAVQLTSPSSRRDGSHDGSAR